MFRPTPEDEAIANEVTEEDFEEIIGRTPWQLFWERFREDWVALGSAAVIIIIALLAIFAPLFVKLGIAHSPNQIYPNKLTIYGNPTGPSRDFIFGTDTVGEDVFARVLYGARVSLEVALLSTGIAVTIGVVLGMLAGYFRGIVDTVIARFIDVMLAFPILLFAIGIGATCSSSPNGCLGGLIKPGITTVVVVIALASWNYIARIVRGQVLSLREKEFVEAAQASGAGDLAIIFREILPTLVAPIIVYTTLIIPTNILFEAALSYLGVGIPANQPSWGQMISQSSQIYAQAWWYFAFPGAALLITVLAFNLLGDAVRDALDPRTVDA